MEINAFLRNSKSYDGKGSQYGTQWLLIDLEEDVCIPLHFYLIF